MNKDMLAVYYTLLRPPANCGVPKGEESIACIKFANHLRAWTIEGKLKAVWFHVANGIEDWEKSPRARGFQMKLKAMGRINGVSDYVFGTKHGSYFMEFKAKKGVLSDSQKAFGKWCEELEIPYSVVKSFEEAEAKLREWEILK